MIIVAIETSPEKNVTLKELTASLQNMFSFFNGSYKGWRDSVRHTLSSSPCLIRIDTIKRNSATVWATDLTKAPSNVFKRQDTDISKDGIWDVILTKQLNIPDIPLPPKECPFASTSPSQTSTTTMKAASNSPDFNFSILLNMTTTQGAPLTSIMTLQYLLRRILASIDTINPPRSHIHRQNCQS
jgi:hypothetical protein